MGLVSDQNVWVPLFGDVISSPVEEAQEHLEFIRFKECWGHSRNRQASLWQAKSNAGRRFSETLR
jgi:hypothetical protein